MAGAIIRVMKIELNKRELEIILESLVISEDLSKNNKAIKRLMAKTLKALDVVDVTTKKGRPKYKRAKHRQIKRPCE